MSVETKAKSARAPRSELEVEVDCGTALALPESTGNRRFASLTRKVFLRLFEDVVDELNKSVTYRTREGVSKGAIAARGDLDPAVLSRVLSGRAGTNLHTIAGVLAGCDHRLKIVSVPCEHLNSVKVVSMSSPEDDGCHYFVRTDGVWQEPSTDFKSARVGFYSEMTADGQN